MKSPEPHMDHSQLLGGEITSNSRNPGDASVISAPFLTWATRLLLAYFGVRLVFFALNISPDVPPDEVTHAGLCKVFSHAFLLPENSPSTYEFGLVTNIPWLYYWVMGKLLHLNIFGISDLVFLRFLNIPLAFGTVWYAIRLLRLLTEDRLVRLLLIVVVTNTPMFSFLSASVSYDNLTNFLAAMAVYYLSAFFNNRSGNLLALSILCQLAGSLTKASFLPLVLVLNIVLLIHERRNLRLLPAALAEYLRTSGRRTWVMVLTILVAVVLNVHLYAGNYLRYGNVAPTMSEVLSPDATMQYRLGAREYIFRLYSQEKISYMEALQLAGEIKHAGDKSDTFYMLMTYENLKSNPQLWMGFPKYVAFWFENVVGSIVGIKAHVPMAKDFRYVVPLYLIMMLSLVGFLVRWRPGESGWLPPCLATIVCLYAGFFLYRINYNAYLYYGTPGITLQGRYLFLLLGPFSVLMCHYLLRLFRNDYARYGLAMATALLFISYDFPWFLLHASSEWFSWLPRQ